MRPPEITEKRNNLEIKTVDFDASLSRIQRDECCRLESLDANDLIGQAILIAAFRLMASMKTCGREAQKVS
jgi:hypothetical protein